MFLIHPPERFEIGIVARKLRFLEISELKLAITRILGHCKENALAYSHGQHRIAAVVHMLANDVDPRRRRRYHR